jgi:DNA-binding MarR family transcriptional regulator
MADDSASPPHAPVQPDRISDATLRGLVGYSMKRAFMVISADLARTLEPFELRMMTFTALTLVSDNPGLSQSQLAQAMAVERPNLVVIIDELETRGLITRDRVPTDRRTYALHITADGAQLLARATSAVHRHENAIMGQLSTNEEAALIATLKRIEASGRGRG